VFSPDGTRLVTAKGSPVFWDVTGAVPREAARLAGHSTGSPGLAFTADGRGFASGSFGPSLRVWDLTGPAPRERAVLDEKDGSLGTGWLAFAPDGRLLAAGRYFGNEHLRLWRVGERGLHALTVPPVPARAVAFSPDGRTLAFGDDGWDVHLWDLTGPLPTELALLRGHELPG
jgi:WD40 repeat protein